MRSAGAAQVNVFRALDSDIDLLVDGLVRLGDAVHSCNDGCPRVDSRNASRGDQRETV